METKIAFYICILKLVSSRVQSRIWNCIQLAQPEMADAPREECEATFVHRTCRFDETPEFAMGSNVCIHKSPLTDFTKT
jgi:hypothetical protein